MAFDIHKAFGYDLAYGQLRIIKNILDKDVNRLIISACTRYGKTRAVAIGTLLYIWNNPHESVILLAPKSDQTGVIRNYISEHIASIPEFRELANTNTSRNASSLKREFSKKRVTFDKNRELRSLTAGGDLMSFGGDLIIVDQSEGVKDDKWRGGVTRMLGDNPNAQLVEIINPWVRNHVWEHWNDPRFKTIHIDWRQAVREGRLTQEFVDEQRKELTDYEFTVLYEAKFPEESENALIKYGWLEDAMKRRIENYRAEEVDYFNVWGLDVAEGGKDHNVLTKTIHAENKVVTTSVEKWDEADTMKTVNRVTDSKGLSKMDTIRVDSQGVGKGVADRLIEKGLPVEQTKFGESPRTDPDRYMNLKAEGFMNLRELFEEERISIPENRQLVKELSEIEKKHTSSGKIKIEDPDKSPDHADSLMLASLPYSSEPLFATV